MKDEVIKSFLVGLGFGVDQASLSQFYKAISSAALRVTALYASVKVASAGIFFGITKISEGFEQMGYEYRIISPAINKALMLRQALLSAYRAAGINITKVVKQSVLFNFSLAKTKFALDAIYKSVGAKFLPLLTKQLDIFRTKIYANLPKIQAILEKFVNFIFKAFEATNILGSRLWSILGRVYDFLVKLDSVTGGWSTKVLALIAVWKFLNLAFIRTPLGMILTGLLAILALYDDFKVWQEGGQSLINWGSQTVRTIALIAAPLAALVATFFVAGTAVSALGAAWGVLATVAGILSPLLVIFTPLMWAVNAAMAANPVGLMIAGFAALIAIIGLVIYKWSALKEWFSSFFGWASDKLALFSNAIQSVFGKANSAPALTGISQPAPLVPQNTGVNQKISQETNILLQGGADANANGQAVASQQDKVNFNMTRNFVGAFR